MQPTVAYLADGKLFLTGERGERLIESRFAQELIDQAERIRQKNEWKMRSETGRVMSGAALWGGADTAGAAARRIQISSITCGPEPGTLIYSLDTDAVGGLFRYDLREQDEVRLFHHNTFRARHLSREPGGKRVAFSLHGEDGSANVAVMDLEGVGWDLLTEGDSVDEAPSWVPGKARLVYQSAGLGRDQHGVFAGTGPYAVEMLDLERQDVETLLEDPKRDFLLPRMDADGALYFIRRPYQTVRAPGIGAVAKDVLLFPFRLVWAVLGFLNFFSLMFSGNPLMTAGGPKKEGPQARHLMLWGKMIDAEQAERRAKKGEPVALVPKEWELVRRSPSGSEEVLAESVLSYDLCPDGSVVFTNGSAVYHRTPDGRRTRLCDGKRIEHVTVTG